MKKILILLMLLMIFPVVSADVIMPGYSPIKINNKITNVNDYPDYVFVSAPDIGGELGPGFGMCSIMLVQGDGSISSYYYKFCGISVYAVKKTDIDLNDFDAEGDLRLKLNEEETKEYFLSLNPKEVIKNVKVYKSKPITSIIEAENNFYAVDLSQVKEAPDSQEIEKNNLIYFYIIVPLIALIIIIYIIVKRGKNKR